MNNKLEEAIQQTDLAAVKQLMKEGVAIDAVNTSGKTALMLALEAVKNKQIYSWETSGYNGSVKATYRVKNGLFTYWEEDKKCAFSLKSQKECSQYSWGPTGQAAYYDAIDIVLAIAKLEQNIEHRDEEGNTALLLAAQTGEPRILKALLKLGADLGASNNNEKNIIHAVAASGRLDAIKLVFKQLGEIDINAQDEFGWTPLHYLMNAGDNPMALDFLISQEAINASITSTKEHQGFSSGVTALDVGQYKSKRTVGVHESYEILKSKYQLLAAKNYLAAGGNPNKLSNEEESVLSIMIRNSNMTADTAELIVLLIEKGIDVNTLDDTNQFNPLMYILLKMMNLGSDLDKKTKKYYVQIAKALIDNGTDLSYAKPSSNQKVLRDSGDISEEIGEMIVNKLVNDYPEFVKELNYKDNDGFTVCHTAARQGHTKLLKLLVQHGADINIPENYGFLPLHEAIIAEKYETVKFLLKNGADITHQITAGYDSYESGDNAVAIAKKTGNTKITALFG